MRRRCEALARKYRDSDEGVESAVPASGTPSWASPDAPQATETDAKPAKASDRRPELYKGSLPSY